MAKSKGTWSNIPQVSKPEPVVAVEKEKSLDERVQEEKAKIIDKVMKFTGEVMTFIYRPHLGFADYAIVKLRLEDGVVKSVEEVSDPYAAFEARAHMETRQAYHLEKMRRSYPAGFQHV